MSKYATLLTVYGSDILGSELFEKARLQTHHLTSDVASHSINTALFCILIYNLFRLFNVKLNIKLMVVAALVHDLGILGRYEKFASQKECLREHAGESITTVKRSFPEVDAQVYDVIGSHMYPIGDRVPDSREAWVLTIADKCAACTDFFRHYSVSSIVGSDIAGDVAKPDVFPVMLEHDGKLDDLIHVDDAVDERNRQL